MAEAAFSIDDLNLGKKHAEAIEFEYRTPEGDPTGIFLSILGAQAEQVQSEVNRLVNDRRKKEAARASSMGGGRGNRNDAEFTPIEDDILFGQRLAAVRLVGWRGIKEPFTPELGLKLCQTNADIADQITKTSNGVSVFTKSSPRA